MIHLIEALRHCLGLLDPEHDEDQEYAKLIERLIAALEAFDTP